MIADQRDAVRVMHPGDGSRWAMAVAGVLCVGAVMPFLPWAASNAVFVALCAMSAVACCAACVNAFPGGGTRMHGVARASMVVGLLGTLSSGATLLCDLNPALFAAFVVSVAICAMQLMPNLVVHVPDRYLVEWRTYMSTRWTVRGTIPQEARILRARDVQPDMDGFLASYDAGIVWCTCLVPLAYAGLAQWAPADTPWSRIGLLVLTVSLVCWLLLRPRQAGRSFERYLMRIAGIAVAVIALTHLPAAMALDAAIVLVVAGCLMVAVMLAQRGGLYSLVLSRIGDGLCFLALGLVPPSALLAAGLLEWLRGMQW